MNLRIVEVSHNKPRPRRHDPSLETLARADRRWLHSLPAPDPSRIDALYDLLPPARTVIDIGCGHGELTRRLHDSGAIVTAVDAASLPLQNLPCATLRAALPFIPVPTRYDLVLCTHVIGELPPSQYRLTLSTLAALTKPGGHCLLSTDLDRKTHDPLDHFYDLFETEFRIAREWTRKHRWTRRPTDIALLGRLRTKKSRR